MKSPDLSARLAAEANIVVGSTPEEFAAHMGGEPARIGKVIRVAGITLR